MSSLDSNGFTLSWTTNDSVATQILYLALGSLNVTEAKVTALSASAHDEGVRLTWRTTFEVDNLGFHVHREQDGERVRLTPTLLPGSALFAGPGRRLTAGRSYSWWDTAAPSTDGRYWIEAVDLRGFRTWHGQVDVQSGASISTGAEAAATRAAGVETATPRAARVAPAAPRASPAPSLAAGSGHRSAQQALAGTGAIKLLIAEPGWYRVTQTELVAAGLSPSVDPRTLQLRVEGREVPLAVRAQQPDRLAPGDVVEFYGVGLDTPWTDTRVYWLTVGDRPGKRLRSVAFSWPQPPRAQRPRLARMERADRLRRRPQER
jgi:hypothetical protein